MKAKLEFDEKDVVEAIRFYVERMGKIVGKVTVDAHCETGDGPFGPTSWVTATVEVEEAQPAKEETLAMRVEVAIAEFLSNQRFPWASRPRYKIVCAKNMENAMARFVNEQRGQPSNDVEYPVPEIEARADLAPSTWRIEAPTQRCDLTASETSALHEKIRASSCPHCGKFPIELNLDGRCLKCGSKVVIA